MGGGKILNNLLGRARNIFQPSEASTGWLTPSIGRVRVIEKSCVFFLLQGTVAATPPHRHAAAATAPGSKVVACTAADLPSSLPERLRAM